MSKPFDEDEIHTGHGDAGLSEEGDDVMDDSSDEDDEDNPEEMEKVREGFIVDDDADDADEAPQRRKKHRRRKERAATAADDQLDDDDLELLRENTGGNTANKFKRLKRALPGGSTEPEGALGDFFADAADADRDADERNILDEFEDFIEEDEFSDEDEARAQRAQRLKERERRAGPRLDTAALLSVDRESLQQLFEVFGNGAEYEWALDAQELEDDRTNDAEPTTLGEVFEHAELKARMLTDEDNMVRILDVPERFQRLRAGLNYMELDAAEMAREQRWVARILAAEKGVAPHLEAPFVEAVGKVVEFVLKENWEVPFIWAHRRDFLIHTEEVEAEDGGLRSVVHKLLFEEDLWRIVRLDIEYHLLYEKRVNAEAMVAALGVDDDLVRDMDSLDLMVALQDLQDYVHFTYPGEGEKEEREERETETEKEAGDRETEDNGANGTVGADGEAAVEAPRRKHSKYAVFQRMRHNVLYDAVLAFGISAKEFGENVQDQSAKNYEVPYRIHATDDPLELPADMVARLVQDDDVLYKDPANALAAVRKTYAEEIFHNPKVRHEVRHVFKNYASVGVALTEKGRTSIDAHSAYADIKYAVNRTPADLVAHPDVLLRMLDAEAAGLVVVAVTCRDYDSWFQLVLHCLRSDGTSEIAELWNAEREAALSWALRRLCAAVAAATKDELRRECERLVAVELRARFLARVDQAPFTPFGFDKGTRPNVLALLFGKGDYDSAVVGAFVRDSGKALDFFKSDASPRGRDDDRFTGQLREFFDRSLSHQKPDVIVIAGFSAASKRLYDVVKAFVARNNIVAGAEDAEAPPPLVPVIWGQDETARLFQHSERALAELADKPPLVRYCVGLARYVQSPLVEYVALGDDIMLLAFYDHQKLLPQDTVREVYDTVFVDIVNMVGVEINEALREPSVAQLLPYVAGLGPRKASGLLRNIAAKLGTLATRSDLIENELLTANIFFNCLSFLNIPYDDTAVRGAHIELLDATRIHPEDYSLARKMAADALDLDEEDMAHVEEQGGIIYQLVQEGVTKVDDLNLTAFGKELESKFGKRKYATLQSIKEELVNNFEELRRLFHVLDSTEVFRMLTGESVDTFARGTIVPVTINRVGRNYRDDSSKVKFLRVSTLSQISGTVEEGYMLRGSDYAQGGVLQVVVLDVNYDTFSASFSALPDDIKKAAEPKVFKEPGKWDFDAEEADRQRERAKENAQLARTRNIQHPLFHNFNHKQAEEFLAPQSVGDCVLRPSSKGPSFLTVTWKVANNLFQHLSVEEVPSANGSEYVVDRKRYSDLDQMIFQHVQAIAKHVNEMCRHPKFREGALAEVHDWLESYTRANPKSSAYVFCYDHKAPGWFLLLFKVNVNTPITTWHVKTECTGFVLKGFSYPNMMRLCNGFKQTFKSLVSDKSRRQPAAYSGYGF